jgi:hypothetical protein
MRIRRLLWGLAVVPLFAVPWLASASKVEGPPSAKGPASQPVKAAGDFALVGTASCGGRACHGSIEPLGDGAVRQNEFTTWLTHDRHADAYRILLEGKKGEQSQDIERLLHATDGQKVRPQDDARCLSCHVFPGIAGRLSDRSPAERAQFIQDFDGVGCENCHGPAEKWLHEHAQADWRDKTSQEKEALGMHPLGTAAERAKKCVVCHVGSAEADMNHDLIAAGHPRLNFEYGAYFANMPRHWPESAADRAPAAQMKAWAVGQVVTAKAALDLVAARATGPHPWPEFAEYDCFACHHQIETKSWRQQRGYGKRGPGTPAPGTWYLALPRAMASTQKLRPVVDALHKLEGLMEVPYPDRDAVAREAKAAAGRMDALQEQVAGLSYEPAAVRKWLAALADEQRRRELTWDEAAQLYLAAAAYDQAYAGAEDKKAHQAVEALYKGLAFPNSRSSPGERVSGDYLKETLNDLDALLKGR